MLVPATLAASRSPSPANAPPVTCTVAPASVRLSGSDTDAAGATVSVWPAVNDAVEGTPASVGASLTAVTARVVVCGALVLFDALPSSAVHTIVRVAFEP